MIQLNYFSPSAFIAKVDLKAAYRSVPIKTMHHTLTGLRWTFSGDRNATNIVDRMLGFGIRKSPSVFNKNHTSSHENDAPQGF